MMGVLILPPKMMAVLIFFPPENDGCPDFPLIFLLISLIPDWGPG
jgi:hypothetical protein